MAQTKSRTARRSTGTRTRKSGNSQRKRIFTRDPGAEARRAARKQAAKKR